MSTGRIPTTLWAPSDDPPRILPPVEKRASDLGVEAPIPPEFARPARPLPTERGQVCYPESGTSNVGICPGNAVNVTVWFGLGVSKHWSPNPL